MWHSNIFNSLPLPNPDKYNHYQYYIKINRIFSFPLLSPSCENTRNLHTQKYEETYFILEEKKTVVL